MVNTALISAFCLLLVLPLLHILAGSVSSVAALKSGRVLFWPMEWQMDGFSRVFVDDRFVIGYRNTVLITVLGTVISVLLTLLAAFALSRDKFPGQQLFGWLVILPMFLSGGLIPTFLVVKSLGLYDTLWSVVLLGAFSSWNVMVARTYIQTTIPKELWEAAEMDGAGDLLFLFRIVVPLSGGIIAVLVLFYAVAYWNDFFNAMIYISDRDKLPLQVFLRGILLGSASSANLSDLSSDSDAVSYQDLSLLLQYVTIVVSSVPLLVLYPFVQRFFVRGVTIGSVKG